MMLRGSWTISEYETYASDHCGLYAAKAACYNYTNIKQNGVRTTSKDNKEEERRAR